MAEGRRTVRTYCNLCTVRCPSLVTVEGTTIVSLEPDKQHPLGGAICAKGRAAPELHEHPDRINYPMRRTHPKGDPDPGWVRCSWDEALDLIAHKMLEIRGTTGAHTVAFSKGTRGATGLFEIESYIGKLVNGFGSPNLVSTTHLCQWPRDTAHAFYTFGLRALPYPDTARSGCILLWGTNPSATGLGLAQRVVAAKERGAKLIVVDPRRVGLANKADLLLRVRPGTDGALALSVIDVLITEDRFDKEFVQEWTNAPLLVRTHSTQRLLRAEEIEPSEFHQEISTSESGGYAAVCLDGRLAIYEKATGAYSVPTEELALRGTREVKLRSGETVMCKTAFELLAEAAREFEPSRAAEITGVPAAEIVAAGRMLAANRPVAHYLWNGVVQHTNATQTCRAIGVLYALLGDWDRPGGNIINAGLRVNEDRRPQGLSPEAAALRLGRADRPLGPPGISGAVAAYDLYDAILDARPYQVRALITFANNILMGNGDTLRGRKALERLEFFAVVELFHTPTTAYADVLLPAATFMESEALFVNYSAGAVWRRHKVVEPLHERRSDVEIIFDLAIRLGLGPQFFNGDLESAYNNVLAPSGLTWDDLADKPDGVSVREGPHQPRKYAERDPASGKARGFSTPTGKVEIFSDTFAAAGVPGLPAFEEPVLSPVRTPKLARKYPLVLTTAKRATYLHSQHRGVAALRKIAPHPTAQIHPATAGDFGVADGDWIYVETPDGRARFKADVTEAIIEGVVCVEHGWWQGCEALGLPALDPYSERGSNANLIVLNDRRDPVSGSTPFRSSLCRITLAPDPMVTAQTVAKEKEKEAIRS